VSGRYVAVHGSIGDPLYRLLLVPVEEGLEMAGVVALLHALLRHLAEQAPQWQLGFGGTAAGAAHAHAPAPGRGQAAPLAAASLRTVRRARTAALVRPPRAPHRTAPTALLSDQCSAPPD